MAVMIGHFNSHYEMLFWHKNWWWTTLMINGNNEHEGIINVVALGAENDGNYSWIIGDKIDCNRRVMSANRLLIWWINRWLDCKSAFYR